MLFKLNVETYPNSADVYDGLAEALALAGDREAAITNCRKSLALDPNDTNAVRKLKELGASP